MVSTISKENIKISLDGLFFTYICILYHPHTASAFSDSYFCLRYCLGFLYTFGESQLNRQLGMQVGCVIKIFIAYSRFRKRKF